MKNLNNISFFLSSLKKNASHFTTILIGKILIASAVILPLSSSLIHAQNKAVVVTETLTAPTGSNYHALENMTLDAGFIYDANSSGLFYAETGDFPNAEPDYGNDRNKVITEIAKEATDTDTELAGWTKDKKHTVIHYSDGLGRSVQSVYKEGTPLGKDIVQHFEYDAQGRGSKAFLPYVSSATSINLHANAAANQAAFYDNSSDDIADSDTPYAETEFDNSPLGRVLKQGAPGDEWQLNSGNTPEFEFHTNDSGLIRKFTSSGTSTTTWNADLLAVSETTDENGNKVEQYSDKLGRLILKKVEQSTGIWSHTYHVYDDMNRLTYTIQPEGYQKMVTDNNYNVSHVLSDYVFSYSYDDRGRLTEKKVPGADPVYYIYDVLDRVVLIQDGILRTQNKWSYNKYDHKHRVVMTGFHVDATNTTRAAKQTEVDGFSYGTVNHYEQRNTSSSTDYYTNRAYPTSGNTVQMVYYYDDYNFDGTGAEQDYQYTSQGFGNVPDYDALNRRTAMKQKILGETTWLWTVTFYDRKGQPIQSKSNNQRQSALNDLVTTKYHFDGRVEETTRYVDAGLSGTVDVDNRFDYDDAGRLTKVFQTNPSDTEQQIAEYNYNELGQLIEKELHKDGDEFIQSVDFRYNIRGWLTQINGSDLASDAINSGDDQNDIFGIDLLYTASESGIGNTAFHNGNISAVKWQTDDPNSSGGVKRKRSYAFSYDKSDRLTDATYKAHNGSNWTTEEQGAYDVSGISYDRNGNIQGLNRYYQADETSSRSQIDNLNYTYAANRLTKVEDAADDALGFKEGTGQTTEYTYDSNGNILTDTNKGLTYSYNDLNKTQKVEFSSTKYIEYTHTAAGGRIEKHVKDDAASIDETWYYIKGFVFKDNDLDHFAMSEGVVRKVDGDLRYEYFLTDHQGNTRMSFTSGQQDIYLATMETEYNSTESLFFANLGTRATSVAANITSGGNEASRLDSNNPIGPALAIKVSAGDKLDLETWAYYEGGSGYSSTAGLTGFIASLAGAFGGVSGGTGEAGDIFDGINDMFTGMSSLNGTGDDEIPAAYLNYILVKDDFSHAGGGFTPISDAADWDKEKLSLNDITVQHSGYAFIYVSLESDVLYPVHFDDLTVTHTKKITVLQENHYYPFGLSMQGVATHVPTPSNTTANKYLYNQGSEQVELDIRNYDTFFRQYDPTLGRFQAMDPLADLYGSQTPYNFAFNDPIALNDPNGDTPLVGHRVNLTDPYAQDACGDCTAMGTVDYYEDTQGSDCATCTLSVTMSSRMLRDASFARFMGFAYRGAATPMVSAQAAKAKAVARAAQWAENSRVGANGSNNHKFNLAKTLATPVKFGSPTKSLGSYTYTHDGKVYTGTSSEYEILGSTGATFYSDPTKAFNDMWNNSFRGDRVWRENSAFMVNGGVIVLPTEGFAYDGKNKTNKYRVNRSNRSANDYLPTEVIDGKLHVIYDGISYEVLAQIHTHPNGINQKPGPGDARAARGLGIGIIFTIGTHEVWKGTLGSGRSKMGSRQGLLNGAYFLLD